MRILSKSYTQKPKNNYFNYFAKNNNFTQQEEVGIISLPPLCS